ncbi:non-ribosomal peptide synthetase module [Paenibacillus psychroresistens]|uniref:Non-ribosomal peptide synthetase module n=1 Tax=Paenibacillus psychroresistens TaxID=1778678 RepID=A0A6B8RIG9_9BACL|nr:non-ribosomal peptide synthetase module [Paenibacillus psychroresistens]QGQ95362.1 non-ribosomal peptide synthetase module [Paenibacillus psychroresistens]
MAQRLATEYVKTCLVLTEAEMFKFVTIFADHQVQLQVKVLENGSQDVVFQDAGEDEIVLSFERLDSKYVFTGSCRLSNPNLVTVMRKAVAEFKGSATVNRIYPSYTMVYQYNRGAVIKIIEIKAANEKIIYEYKDTVDQLKLLFLKQNVEYEIQAIHQQINEVLDLRNLSIESTFISQIDQRLQQLSHRLFSLEV